MGISKGDDVMETKLTKIGKIKLNPDNPRIVDDEKFNKLVNSIKEFPQMLDIRPIVVNADMMVLGGNMRLKACKEAGLKEVPTIKAKDLTEEQQREFIIKDNVGFGTWDWELLSAEWNTELLGEWGLELEFTFDSFDDDSYTKKIDAPKYEPSETKPNLKELVDTDKTDELIDNINKADIASNVKEFLIKSAQRHTVFDYSKIADFYTHSDKYVQELMEESALIIIDFKKAIAQGYVNINQEITDKYIEEYGNEA
jgi:hypothetical protein